MPRYEQAHNRRFIWLVGPGLVVALASAAVRPNWIRTTAWTALGVLDLIALALTASG